MMVVELVHYTVHDRYHFSLFNYIILNVILIVQKL